MKKIKKGTIENLKENQKKTKELAKKAVNDYKKFAIKGNVLDMAIGVVIGSAFTNIVNTLVSSTITPLISLLTSNVDLSTLFVTLKGGNFESLEAAKTAGAITWNYGSLINAILNFFIISIVLFIIVKVISMSNKKDAKAKEKTTKECPYCLSTIPIKAIKCAHCASDLIEKKEENSKRYVKKKHE
ncbi:MAG: large conductance mechanosensitive channel protein MscL [Clostridia bacterium]|nr:large conductance mechanosensitive channel protein MscL [Clostridia bacterium]